MDIFTALLCVSGKEPAPTSFKFTIKTDAITAGKKITTFPIIPDGSTLYPEDFIIAWGDGTTTTKNASTVPISTYITHTYATAGTKQITVSSATGKLPAMTWNGLTNEPNYQLVSIDTPFPTMYSNETTICDFSAGYQSYVFTNCTSLTTLCEKMFKFNPQIASFSNMFSYCTSLASLPQDLLWYTLTSLDFTQTFYGSGITAIPQDFFKNIVGQQPSIIFDYVFGGCLGLTAVPRLFNNCTFSRTDEIAEFGLTNMFSGCPNLVTVASDLFYNCSLLSNCISLANMFYNNYAQTSMVNISAFTGLLDVSNMYASTAITAIPTDYFRYNTLINNFNYCFSGCAYLETTPDLLLKYQTANDINFSYMFNECTKHKQNSNLFCTEASEKTTRFAGKTAINFQAMFVRNSWTGGTNKGTAPTLWNYTFGATPTRNYCWSGSGNSTSSLTNYGSITSVWKT